MILLNERCIICCTVVVHYIYIARSVVQFKDLYGDKGEVPPLTQHVYTE